MKKFAVVLSGCGVFDGSEIHEATLAMYAIKKQGATYEVFAPDMDQFHVIDHTRGEPTQEKRNVLKEAARISRGEISPLSDFDAAHFDALLFPGGFGVAKNLSTFAVDGASCTVQPDVERAIRSMHGAGKPIAAMCIAPVLLARLIQGAKLTVGQDEGTVQAVEAMGGVHENTGHAQVVVDEQNLLFTTPCYMLDADIGQIGDGAEAVVRAVLGYA